LSSQWGEFIAPIFTCKLRPAFIILHLKPCTEAVNSFFVG
jgi:hypothetical protein